MSCEQTTQAYEAASDRFFAMLDDYDFRDAIYEWFLSPQDQWLEKENGRLDEYAYMHAFDVLWKWDCEAMHHNIEDCVNRYILKEKRND